MAKIAFLLMVHKDPDRVIAQARALTSHGDCVAIHFDASAPTSAFSKIQSTLKKTPNVAIARRVRCGWGEFSLVRATLALIKEARRRFEGITHYFLISGDCYPTKSRDYFDRYLTPDRDHIEAHDFFDSGWIRTGMTEDRLIYRHWFNEREQKTLFYASLAVQRRFGLSRPLPEGLRIRIGSQWWALRAGTVEKILSTLKSRPDIQRFFRTTWIPDETFFQSLVPHVVPEAEISMAAPTHLVFSDYGMPVVFHSDHMDMLRATDQPMARKISPTSDDFRNHLLDVFQQRHVDAIEGGTRNSIYRFLSAKGRNGERYARRFWERAIEARWDSELLIVACKLWHVGKSVEESIGRIAGIPSFSYVFDEDMPINLSLGNLERGLEKRGRHRKAVLNLLYDMTNSRRVMLAIDPARRDIIDDLAENVGTVRLMLVDRPLDDNYFSGHAERMGLLSAASGAFENREVLKTLMHEHRDSLRYLERTYNGRLFHNDLSREHASNVIDFGRFLHVPRATAEAIACEVEKFVD